ncbi:MAG: radical SAM protein [Nitrospinaceae bacterium]|jgi:putative pyruvate formate lyase activating enzyme|nr:MAG: radical SAM protein [Nitrospinaceae bacterium]
MASTNFEPAYMKLFRTGELYQRSREAVRTLDRCRVCPRDCDVDRLADETALCKTGRHAIVSSHFPHFGEEDCLKGTRGSGTIFFSMCNLRCVFCQNLDISQKVDGTETPPEGLALLMMDLQNRGCHNINFVTPEHVVPQILEALPMAVQMGLRLPLVYNTGAYDSLESLRLMDGVVDIYMPDFKYWDAGLAEKYLKARDYPEVAKRAIREMHRQVGDLVIDETGLAQRGLLVRHLLMPGEAADFNSIIEFIVREISPHTHVNIMDQYRPAGKVGATRYPEINRRISIEELKRVYTAARTLGLYRFDASL